MEYTKKEKAILLSIRNSLANAEEDLSCLDNKSQEKILNEHGEDTNLIYCIRWGLQAIEEITNDFK